MFEPSVKIIICAAACLYWLVNIRMSPLLHPVADIVQVHRTEGGSAGFGANAEITHQTEDCCHPAGQTGPQGSGGPNNAAAQTRSETAGDVDYPEQ